MEQQGIYERIKGRVELLKEESRDRFFTEYLVKFDSCLIQEKHRLDLLETQLDQNCQIYRQRMAAVNTAAGEAVVRPLDKPGTGQADTGGEAAVPIQPQPMQFQPASGARKNHEFTIGIHVFGTIGVLFVLAALILLGINYIGSLVWEMGLYVLGLLVWGVAEFVIRKKSPILSMIFSSLGIGSLYVTTMVNFLYLHNFNGLATILITTSVTVVVLFVSRKKDAGILRIVCIGACMVSFLLMDVLNRASDMELLIYMVMIVVVQLLGILLPVKKWAYGIALGQMAGTAVFAWIFAWMFAISTISTKQVMELKALYVIGLVVFSMLIMELTVWRMPVEHEGWVKWICVTFGIGSLLLVWAYRRCTTGFWGWEEGTYYDLEIWIRLGVMAAIAVMGGVFFFLTGHKSYLRWIQGYFVAGAALLLFVSGSDEQLSVTITLTILTILYKLWAYWRKPLWTADAIITTWTALAALFSHDSVHGYLLLGVLLLGILLMNHWQTYFEFILTGTTIVFITMAVDNEQLQLPLIIAVMWMAALLFNCMKRFVGRGITGFNAVVLVMEVSCYIGLAFFQKFDSVLTYLILTVLGLGIILFTFQARFLRKAEEWRGLAVSVFLTYMVLVTITKFEYRITASILLMAVGLLGIVFGFRQTDRKLRIYGLVLCLMTCFKITLFDFKVQSLQRIILFFAAGAMALFISGIYALMEKKYNRECEGVQDNRTGLTDIAQANDKLKTQGREQGR